MGGLGTQTSVLALGLTLLLAVHGLKFENNAYTDLLIAIHSDVPEDPTIISQLRQMVEDASPYLYHATKRKAYLGQVTILVPSTWTAGSYSSSSDSSLTFTEADVRVDAANPRQMVDAPYVFQPEQCGQPGRYIHLTPGFLTTVPGNYGNKGRVFVHEFAHYRYGVFDEYGDGDLYPKTFVNDANEFTATGCTKASFAGKFVRRNDTSQQCLITDNINQDCFLLLNSTESTAQASIMYAQHVDSVVSFCESTFDLSKRHDTSALNQHNAMCRDPSGGRPRSTWDVVKEHPDMSSPSLSGDMPPNPPDIRVVRPADNTTCGRRLVLVLDVSESMVYKERWFKQNQVGDKLLRDIVPVESEVGIIVFNSGVNVKQNLTVLEDDLGRAKMAKNLPSDYDFWGYTAIGDALYKAKEMLTEGGQSGRGSRILLITDGILTRGRPIAEVEPEIQAAGITVHTIAYGDQADTSLAHLSQITGGQYAYYSERGASNLDSAIERLWSDFSICQGADQVTILQETVRTTPGSVKAGTVSIDSDIGRNTVFFFTFRRGLDLKVNVTSPSGTVITQGSGEYKPDKKLSIIRILISDAAEAGQWQYSLEDPSSEASDVAVAVRSRSRTGEPPIVTENWVGDTTLSSEVQYIYVYVHKGYAPVLGADVTVRVELPVGGVTTLRPLDSGLAPDVKKGDGVYTVAMPKNAIGNGRVSISASTRTFNATIPFLSGNGTGAIPVVPVPPESTETRPAGDVTRVTSGGAFDVTNATSPSTDVTEASDEVAPSTVSDLTADTDLSTRIVTLTWTSPGDDLSLGTASRYDMRMAASSSQLQDNFNSAREVLDAMLTSGSLVPLPAGSDQAVSVSVSADWTSSVAVFALKAVDEANNTGFLSNVAVASLTPPTFDPVVTVPPPVETTTPGENSNLPSSTSSLPASTASSLPANSSSLPDSSSSIPDSSSLPDSSSSIPDSSSLPDSSSSIPDSGSLPDSSSSLPASTSSIPTSSSRTEGAPPESYDPNKGKGEGNSQVPVIVGAVVGTASVCVVLAVIAFVVHKFVLKGKRRLSPPPSGYLVPSAMGSYDVSQQWGHRRTSEVSVGAINLSPVVANGAPPASSSIYPNAALNQAYWEASRDLP